MGYLSRIERSLFLQACTQGGRQIGHLVVAFRMPDVEPIGELARAKARLTELGHEFF